MAQEKQTSLKAHMQQLFANRITYPNFPLSWWNHKQKNQNQILLDQKRAHLANHQQSRSYSTLILDFFFTCRGARRVIHSERSLLEDPLHSFHMERLRKRSPSNEGRYGVNSHLFIEPSVQQSHLFWSWYSAYSSAVWSLARVLQNTYLFQILKLT